jgi:hypothetical protein
LRKKNEKQNDNSANEQTQNNNRKSQDKKIESFDSGLAFSTKRTVAWRIFMVERQLQQAT